MLRSRARNDEGNGKCLTTPSPACPKSGYAMSPSPMAMASQHGISACTRLWFHGERPWQLCARACLQWFALLCLASSPVARCSLLLLATAACWGCLGYPPGAKRVDYVTLPRSHPP